MKKRTFKTIVYIMSPQVCILTIEGKPPIRSEQEEKYFHKELHTCVHHHLDVSGA